MTCNEIVYLKSKKKLSFSNKNHVSSKIASAFFFISAFCYKNIHTYLRSTFFVLLYNVNQFSHIYKYYCTKYLVSLYQVIYG